MPIELDKVRGAELPEVEARWGRDDVILYRLGLGAGTPPTDSGELEYVYEGALKVLPSYAVLPAMGSLLQMLSMPGMHVDLRSLLHGEQKFRVHELVPAEGRV